MKLELVAQTPNIETMIATSMLTTTSGALPSTLYYKLLKKPQKVKEIVGRGEVQHGNILEHNRLIWELQATSDEVLEATLDTRFLTFTRIGETQWLVSGNLRTIVEYSQSKKTPLIDALVTSVKAVSPNLNFFQGDKKR